MTIFKVTDINRKFTITDDNYALREKGNKVHVMKKRPGRINIYLILYLYTSLLFYGNNKFVFYH